MPTRAEPEITTPRPLCSSDGRLAADAVGWSRRPLHDCNLRGALLRKKRWNHWAVSDGRHVLIVTLADVDYLGIANVLFRDLVSGMEFEHVIPLPAAIGLHLGKTVDASASFRAPGMHIEMFPGGGGTELRIDARTLRRRLEATITIQQPPGYESMNVVIPWDDRRFQFTSKHAARPAHGTVRVDGATHTLGEPAPAFGCFDFGRGVWPYRTRWHWAAASSHEGNHTVGINLGSLWTDGTGMTENAFWLDGRVHKIADRVVFDFDALARSPKCHVRTERSDRVELEFEPMGDKVVRLQLGLVATKLHVRFGRFRGTLVTGDGERIEVGALDGWAEDHSARW